MKQPRRNMIWQYGLLTAPVIVGAVSLGHAIVLCFAAAAMAIVTAILSRLLPKGMPYGFRILSYSLLAALVYIPMGMASEFLFPQWQLGICLPLLTTSVILMFQSKKTEQKQKLLGDLVSIGINIICLDVGILLLGTIREILSSGTLLGISIHTKGLLPSFGTPAVGMILLGLLGALGRVWKERSHCLQKEESGADESAD